MTQEYAPDFTQGEIWHRVTRPDLKHELLYKALGIKKGYTPKVLDTTAGWGKDALIIAALGCEVTLCERHPVVASNLRLALEQAKNNTILQPFIGRMHLVESCSMSYLKNLVPEDRPEVIYCDPMFNHKHKALPKKELQALQSIVGVDSDPAELVETALKYALNRVVVKRAKLSPPYYGTPSFSLKARSHHFDIYLTIPRKPHECNV